MSSDTIPIFPLDTVLFPQGIIALRIYEPRYLTMVSECMRTGQGFGVVLSTKSEKKNEQSFHQIGTLARIEDFDQLEDGYLVITCRGDYRFNILECSLQDDRLINAKIEMLSETNIEALPSELDHLRIFLKDMTEREEMNPWNERNIPQWNNPSWISCRLAELLPLSIESRQALLELSNSARLDQLDNVIKINQLDEQ